MGIDFPLTYFTCLCRTLVVFISVTGHGPALTLAPGPKPQRAVGLVLDIVDDSLLCSDV